MKQNIKHFNLNQIGRSGQCFRWEQLGEDTWQIHALVRRQESVTKEITGTDMQLTASQRGEEIELSCTEEEFEKYWKRYFDLTTDYEQIEETGHAFQDPVLEEAMQFGNGMRILRQDFWETMVSFLISQNNNIPRIKGAIAKLCMCQGKFPLPQEILERDLESCRLGYRDKYLKAAAQWMMVKKQAGEESPEAGFAGHLSEIQGVGPKVEACIRLYGLHDLSFCPMDTWMKRIVREDYENVIPQWMNSPYAGYFQQVCFYAKRLNG